MKRLPFRLTSFAQGTLSHVEGVGRWLFNLAVGVSIALCVATVVWRVFRPYYFYDGIQVYPGNHVLLIGASEGALTIEWADAIAGDFAPQDPTTRPWFYVPPI